MIYNFKQKYILVRGLQRELPSENSANCALNKSLTYNLHSYKYGERRESEGGKGHEEI